MSDTVEENTLIGTEDANKIPLDKGPIGKAGESFFAAEAIKAGAQGDAMKTANLQRDEASFNTFMADQKDAVDLQAAKTVLASATNGVQPAAPRVSESMQQNAEALRRMQTENPAQWQAVQAEINAAKASPSLESPTIVIKPSLRDRVLAFFGFGKKQEPVRQ